MEDNLWATQTTPAIERTSLNSIKSIWIRIVHFLITKRSVYIVLGNSVTKKIVDTFNPHWPIHKFNQERLFDLNVACCNANLNWVDESMEVCSRGIWCRFWVFKWEEVVSYIQCLSERSSTLYQILNEIEGAILMVLIFGTCFLWVSYLGVFFFDLPSCRYPCTVASNLVVLHLLWYCTGTSNSPVCLISKLWTTQLTSVFCARFPNVTSKDSHSIVSIRAQPEPRRLSNCNSNGRYGREPAVKAF